MCEDIQYYTWFGVFTIKNEKVVDYNLFPKDVHKLAELMEERTTTFSGSKTCCIDMVNLAINQGVVNTREEYYNLLQDVMLEVVKNKIRTQWTKDVQIIQAASTIDELDKIINLLQERLNTGYSIHFPEHGMHALKLAELISTYGSRNNIPADHALYEKAISSTGMNLTGQEEQLLQALAANVLHLYKLRGENEDYLNHTLPQFAPNLTSILGANLAARMISLVGSLEKLSEKPASTIQVTGASKALFKHLRKHAPPPKHGIIYQHPLVKNAPYKLRGKTSRALAGKIAISARIDYYNGSLNPQTAQDLKKRIAQIKG
ncbi:MAG: putative NOP5 family protein [Candidatus Argoarchaeum ethanivorans]|uniref:Putative NOP5 family protein n=1 Tax=Candidatus Argoarchaeum ethanivorans TaxID=2608793 RepID=A0A811TDG2_9EURY|nr:MAG: putative NOP5 family protein [Candidatus Argoarchaeum ethanivorans]